MDLNTKSLITETFTFLRHLIQRDKVNQQILTNKRHDIYDLTIESGLNLYIRSNSVLLHSVEVDSTT